MKTIIKPWGKEEIIHADDRYVMKRLTMTAGHRCSLQYHEFKKETIYVLNGKLEISIGSTLESIQKQIYLPGDSITLEPRTVHRMAAIETSVYLEASTPELDDVVRLVDDYNRADSQ